MFGAFLTFIIIRVFEKELPSLTYSSRYDKWNVYLHGFMYVVEG